MAKKSRRNRDYSKNERNGRHREDEREQGSGNVVRPFGGGNWHPLDDEIDRNRDKKYVKNITPRTEGQKTLIDAIKSHSLTLAIGPAGSGKTYLAIAQAVEALEAGKVERIVLSRPAMEAGESLGYLPGDMHEKMAPYLRPLYDALGDRLGGKRVREYIQEGVIEIAPVGFMRGRTLNNCFVVIDEAQNCTYAQLKMLLSRLGWHSTMVITDLLPGISGLSDVAKKFESLANIAVVRLKQADIVRHPLVAEMLTVL